MKLGLTGPELGAVWYVGYLETASDAFSFAMSMKVGSAKETLLRKKRVIKSIQAVKLIWFLLNFGL